MRNKSIDRMKGLGIILVVAVHAGLPFAQYVTLFHMAIFFMISGYCYRETYSETFQSVMVFLKKRFIGLYIPYVVTNLILLGFHNRFVDWNIYTDNPLFLQADGIMNTYGLIKPYSVRDHIIQFILTLGFIGGEQLAGTLWFLRALFQIEIFYVVIDWVRRRLRVNGLYFWSVLTVVIVSAGYFLNTRGLHIVSGLETSCHYFVFFVIGIWLQKAALQRLLSKRFMSILLSAVWLAVNGLWITRFHTYENIFSLLYIVNGMMGWLLLKSIADLPVMQIFGGGGQKFWNIWENIPWRSCYGIFFPLR